MRHFSTLAVLLPLAAAVPGAATYAAPASAAAPAQAASPAPAAPASASLPSDVVAQQGKAQLTATQLHALLDHMDPAQRDRLLADRNTLDNFVRDQVLNLSVLAEAKSKNWDLQQEVKQRAQTAYDTVVVQTYLESLVPADPNYPSDEQLNAFYNANRSRLIMPRQVHLAQIVILVPQGASADVDEAAHRKAADLRAQAAKPKADFAALAKKNSQETNTAAHGGDVGFLREDQLLPIVRDGISGLSEGGVSEALRAPDGWHVVKLLGTKPAGEATLADVRPQLVQAMRQGRAQAAVRAHVQQLVQQEPIQLNEIELSKTITVGH
jgi:parvulin-like peptidyl-prolyl isomerase